MIHALKDPVPSQSEATSQQHKRTGASAPKQVVKIKEAVVKDKAAVVKAKAVEVKPNASTKGVALKPEANVEIKIKGQSETTAAEEATTALVKEKEVLAVPQALVRWLMATF